jgi:hypothetical protein
LSVKTNQGDLWGESEVPQVGRDGAERRGQFPPLVAISPTSIRADPLARVHLKGRGARADHLTTLAPCVAGCADGRCVDVVLQAT